MEREIKFRGLRVDGKGWVYGYYWYDNQKKTHKITVDLSDDNSRCYEVIHETVGQFTGLKDKNGKEIYEGDTVRILYTDWVSKSDSDTRTLEQYLIDISKKGNVVFDNNGWFIEFYSDKFKETFLGDINHGKFGFIEVIGNIHEK